MYDLSVSAARDPLIAITFFFAIALAMTWIRVQTSKVRQSLLGIDDVLIICAMFFLVISIAIEFACVLIGGTGRRLTEIHPLDAVKTLKLILPFEALYGVTLCCVKVSVVTFYLRIFGAARSFRIPAFVVIGIVVAWAVSVILETFLLCRPLAYNWDSTIEGVCGDRNNVYVSAGALNVVTDFMVMSLPIPQICKLQLDPRKKIGLVGMFSLGILSITAISILRIKSLEAISFTDPTFTLPMGLFWTTLEPCLCVINANLPMCRSFAMMRYPRVFGYPRDYAHRASTSGTSGAGRQRTVTGAYGGLRVMKGRADNFEMLTTELRGEEKRDERQSEARSTITSGGQTSIIGAEDMGSQERLTRDPKSGIRINTTVEVIRY